MTVQGVRWLWYQAEDEISPEVAAAALQHQNVSTDEVSVVVKDTLCLLLAQRESLNTSTMKAFVTLDLWVGDHKIFIVQICAEHVQEARLTKREINRSCFNTQNS